MSRLAFERIRRLQDEIQDGREGLAAAEARAAALSREVAEFAASHTAQHAVIVGLSDERQALTQEAERLGAEVEALKARAESIQEEALGTNQALAAAKGEAAALRGTLASLTAQRGTLQDANAAAHEQVGSCYRCCW